MKNLYSSFIKKLEQQTESGKLQWDTIFRVSHAYDITENFGYILMSNEYHQVDEVKSYGVLDRDGLSFFLLNETFESGKDGSSSCEKNLYVVEGINGKSYQIPVKKEELLRLEEKIELYIRYRYMENLELDKLLQRYLDKN